MMEAWQCIVGTNNSLMSAKYQGHAFSKLPLPWAMLHGLLERVQRDQS